MACIVAIFIILQLVGLITIHALFLMTTQLHFYEQLTSAISDAENIRKVHRMAEKSAIQRIKELDEERARIFEQAKEEALGKAKAAVAELNGLGLDYTLVGGESKKARAPKAATPGKGVVKSAPCSICGFQTSPPHDARAHRGQSKKKPFTTAELEEKGLTQV